ncbi:hypothetical protein ACFLU3_04695, partial [Chloroflexota bacterium]
KGNMKEEDRKKIEEIMGKMSCPQNYKCTDEGFEKLCKAKDMKGVKRFIECLEDNPKDCTFTRSFGHSCLCKCPLRVCLSKELKL